MCRVILTYTSEFTPHQREVFCVFWGQGVIGLRRYLNTEERTHRGLEFDDDEVTLTGDDDNQTMTGMMSATALNGAEDETEADEELDDADDSQLGGAALGGDAQP
jgi:F-box and leucine-rich repeat protein GRR1